MENMKMVTKADKLFFSFTNGDQVIIIGSRKVNQLDLSAEFEGIDINSFYGRGASGYIPMPPSYQLTGSMRGFIQTVGSTFEEALFNLLLAFREEEREEKEQARLLAEYAAERQANPVDDDWDYYDEDYSYNDQGCGSYDCNCYDQDE